MHLLVVNFIILLIVGGICSFIKSKQSTRFYVFFSAFMLLSLRVFVDIHSVPDLEPYSWGYEQFVDMAFLKVPVAEINYVKIPEIGFRYLMKICGYVSPSFAFFLFIYGLLWIGGYLKIILAYSPYVIISLVMLTVDPYNQSIFVIRQHLAMLVVFCSYKYIIEKKIWKYLYLILLACLLHQTAIISLPLYFLYHVRGRKKIIIAIIAITLFMYFSFSYLLVNVGENMVQGFSSYIDSDEHTNATGAIIVAFELLLYVLVLREHVLDNGINKILFFSLVIGLILSICGIGFNPTGRLVMYYTSISFLLVPLIAKYTKSIFVRNIIVLIFISLYAYMAFFGSGFDSLKYYKLDL